MIIADIPIKKNLNGETNHRIHARLSVLAGPRAAKKSTWQAVFKGWRPSVFVYDDMELKSRADELKMQAMAAQASGFLNSQL